MTNPTPAPAEALSLPEQYERQARTLEPQAREVALCAARDLRAALARAEAAEAERDKLREATEKWATITRLAQYALGDPVKKKSGGAWRGYVVGYYSASLTPIGYAVESHFEPGSVQIYPARALERWEAHNE